MIILPSHTSSMIETCIHSHDASLFYSRDYAAFISCSSSITVMPDCIFIEKSIQQQTKLISNALGGICNLNLETTTPESVTFPHVTSSEECDETDAQNLRRCYNNIDKLMGVSRNERKRKDIEALCRSLPHELYGHQEVILMCSGYIMHTWFFHSSALQELHQCQNDTIHSGICHELRAEADQTLAETMSIVDPLCDQLEAETTAMAIIFTSAPNPGDKMVTTADMHCMDYEVIMTELKNCSNSIIWRIDNFKGSDWLDDHKVPHLCRWCFPESLSFWSSSKTGEFITSYEGMIGWSDRSLFFHQTGLSWSQTGWWGILSLAVKFLDSESSFPMHSTYS